MCKPGECGEMLVCSGDRSESLTIWLLQAVYHCSSIDLLAPSTSKLFTVQSPLPQQKEEKGKLLALQLPQTTRQHPQGPHLPILGEGRGWKRSQEVEGEVQHLQRCREPPSVPERLDVYDDARADAGHAVGAGDGTPLSQNLVGRDFSMAVGHGTRISNIP